MLGSQRVTSGKIAQPARLGLCSDQAEIELKLERTPCREQTACRPSKNPKITMDDPKISGTPGDTCVARVPWGVSRASRVAEDPSGHGARASKPFSIVFYCGPQPHAARPRVSGTVSGGTRP